MAKAPIGIPIVASLAAFVLVLLALLSGSRQGFLERCDMVTFNTSQLGKNLISTSTGGNSPSTTTECSTGSFDAKLCSASAAVDSAVSSAIDAVETDLVSALDRIEDELADKLAQTLGIQEFYSLHVLDACEGNYQPNATADGARRNVTSCEPVLVTGYNISAVLDHQLRIGPFNLSLSHLQFSQELQDDLNTLHGITEAFAIMFIIGAGFTGLELVASVLSLYLVPRHERLALILNPALSSLAAFTLVLAGLVATIGAHTTVDKVNGAGADVGLSAAVGVEFEAFVWTGAGLMMVTLAWYLFHLVRFRRGYSIRPAAAAAPAPSRQLSEMDEKHNQPRHVRTGEGAWGKFRESFVSGWSRRT